VSHTREIPHVSCETDRYETDTYEIYTYETDTYGTALKICCYMFLARFYNWKMTHVYGGQDRVRVEMSSRGALEFNYTVLQCVAVCCRVLQHVAVF